MKTIAFLRDIDDEHLYAQQLELAWIRLGDELSEILARWPLIVGPTVQPELKLNSQPLLADLDAIYADLATMRQWMSLLARDMAERARRLADAAVGLPDRVLDEQSAQREPRSASDRGD